MGRSYAAALTAIGFERGKASPCCFFIEREEYPLPYTETTFHASAYVLISDVPETHYQKDSNLAITLF